MNKLDTAKDVLSVTGMIVFVVAPPLIFSIIIFFLVQPQDPLTFLVVTMFVTGEGSIIAYYCAWLMGTLLNLKEKLFDA